MNQEHHQVLKKHQFQIRKVPLRRFIPEKTPELYAMDAHSICLPSKIKRKEQWGSLYSQANYCNYEQEFNQQILSSQAYKELYNRYLKMRDERLRQKSEIQMEIRAIQATIVADKEKQGKLSTTRDELYSEIQGLRNQLAECKQKNYNLRWQLYNQRGARYANLYGYSFLEPNELTYEQLLQMEEQIGSVSRGLSLEDIEKLDRRIYECSQGHDRQICCICYDEIQEQQWVTVLKCSHTHHCDCIKDWLVKQKICPICKKEVVLETQTQIEQEAGKIMGVVGGADEVANPECDINFLQTPMYNESVVNINDNYDELQPEFFNSMFEAQQNYFKNRDQQSMKVLLCFYTDCVSYFEIKQETISEYFQTKIKEIVKEIKQFGTQELAEKNKEKMSKNIIRVMQEENIQQQISSILKKEQKINEAVNKILQEQNEKLERRLMKTKRTMSKCQSVTMSFASIDSSPELKPNPPQRKPLDLKTKFLFTKDIGSDEENSTS